MNESKNATIVVFDTNIWKSNLYLKSAISSSVKAYLKLNNAKIGLPEVIELEIKKHLEDDIRRCRSAINENFQRLLSWFGELKEVVLPEDEAIDELVGRYLDFSDLTIERVPFDLASARGSFDRIISGRRPCHRNQQFKDGVIWEICKRWSSVQRVVIVTNDKAFFEDDDLKKGLATELSDEIKDTSVSLCASLTDLLESIKRPIEVENDRIDRSVKEQIWDSVESLAWRNGFLPLDGTYEIDFFATEVASSLFVDVSGTVLCAPKEGVFAKDPRIQLRFDGTYSVDTGEFSDLSPSSLVLTYSDEEGTEIQKRSIFARGAGLVVGHRTVRHSVRNALN